MLYGLKLVVDVQLSGYATRAKPAKHCKKDWLDMGQEKAYPNREQLIEDDRRPQDKCVHKGQ